MKFLCPACDRLAELSSFRLAGSSLVVSCPKCGEESRASGTATIGRIAELAPTRVSESVARETSGDPFQVPPGHCPKCIALYPTGASSCAQCGLTFGNIQPEDYRPTEAIAALWTKLLSRWEDEAAHDQFLQATVAQGELASAGRLYRLRLAYAPADAQALRGRDEVLRLATVTSAGLDKTPMDMPRVLRWQHLALLFFILLCAAVVILVYRQIVLRGL